MRDSQSLLDQMMAFSEGHLTADKAHAIFGTAGDDRIVAFADAIFGGDAKAGLEQIHQASARGMQLGELLDQLVDYWRGLMLILTAGPEFGEIEATPALLAKLKGHAAGRNLDTILAGIDILAATKQKVRGSTHVQVLLEVALIRLSRLDELLSVGQLAAAMAGGAPMPAGKAAPPPTLAEAVKKKPLTAPDEPLPASNGELSLPDLWARLIEKLGPIRGNHLRQAGLPAILGPNTLAIRVPEEYTAAYDSLAAESTLEAVRQNLQKLSGQEWSIRVEKTKGAAEKPLATETAKPTESYGLRSKEVMELPLFKAAAEALGAQIVKIDPGFNPLAIPAVAPELAPTATLELPTDDEG